MTSLQTGGVRDLSFENEIYRSPVDSPHKDSLMSSLHFHVSSDTLLNNL